MRAFDRFYSKEKLIRKTIEIDDDLYEQLKKLSKEKIDASVNQLINACIEELIRTENIQVYKKDKSEIALKHSLLIRESLVEGLEKLKGRYELSIYKLVNMSIYNALNEYYANKDKLI